MTTYNHLVCVTGYPRTGKDTFVDFARIGIERATGPRVWTHRFSMIDDVRTGLQTGFNINTSAKTPADRALLVAVGDAVEAHSRFKTNALLRAMEQNAQTQRDNNYDPAQVSHAFWFVQVREQHIIDGLREHFETTTVVAVVNTAALVAFDELAATGQATATDIAVGNITNPDVLVVNPYNDAGVDAVLAYQLYNKRVDASVRVLLERARIALDPPPAAPWWRRLFSRPVRS